MLLLVLAEALLLLWREYHPVGGLRDRATRLTAWLVRLMIEQNKVPVELLLMKLLLWLRRLCR